MKHTLSHVKQMSKRASLLSFAVLLSLISLSSAFSAPKVSAATLTTRSLTLSSSSAEASNATTTYTFDFTIPTTGTTVQSFEALMCTTATGACTTPTGFDNSSATITQPTNLGDASGWTVSTATSGALRLSKTGNTANPSGSQTVVFNNVQNPTTANTTFFARLTTFSDDAWSTSIDEGTVAASTTELIELTGTVDETLVFCTGTSGTDCGDISGTTVDFGTFSSTATSSGTSLFGASTNSAGGYTVTINGSTLTCTTCAGSPTIAALASQTASSTGTAQFGANLRNNTTPNVGADPSGAGSGTYTSNYGTADQYRFVTGDDIASAASATDANLFTVSYIVNIPGSQPAGVYTSTMTFIATATF